MEEKARINAIAGPAPSEFPSKAGLLGIVMLETSFPRPLGDIGNPASFFPERKRRMAPTDLVPECTNMPPYAKRIEAATGFRTWSLLQATPSLH
jgi:hypothetical protein